MRFCKKTSLKKPIYKLDPYEKSIFYALNDENFVSVPDVAKEKELAKKAAVWYLKKVARIHIRLSKVDLDKIKEKASYEGLPYQTLISSILHKYASNSNKKPFSP